MRTEKFSWVPVLLARVSIGWIFIESGWGKLHNLAGVTEFFTSLGIPAARIQAPFVAGVEFAGGILVLAGLFTRWASLPLIGVMGVAILTAKRSDIKALSDLLFMPEYLFIILLTYLAIHGAGALSLDRFVFRRGRKDGE